MLRRKEKRRDIKRRGSDTRSARLRKMVTVGRFEQQDDSRTSKRRLIFLSSNLN